MREKSNKKMMILSFIGIILVALGHTTTQTDLFDGLFPVYSFHMPLFIFISGYFYKTSNEENLKQYIFSKLKKLVIPYFVWNIVYGIILTIVKNYHLVNYGDKFNLYSLFVRPWIDGYQFYINIASWFMLTLFAVNIIYVLMRKLLRKIKLWNDLVFLFIFFIIAVLTIKYSKNAGDYILPLFRVGFFMFFYQLGLVYKFIEKKININSLIKLTIIILIQLLILKIDGSIEYFARPMIFFTKYAITPILTSLTGISFWLIIADILTPALKENKLINYISCHTKEIMMHHMFWIFTINVIIKLLSVLLLFTKFDNNAFMNDIYYVYTGGIPQLAILYTIACIVLPLAIHYLYEKYFPKLLERIKLKKAN